MKGLTTGIIFNIQRYSIHDGPGIRTTVFFKGCPLKCRWCSNPESQNSFPEIAHNDALCNNCARCVEACKVGAISLKDKGITIDREMCTNCLECVDVCYTGALKVFGYSISVDELLQEVRKDETYYRNSGGGVTVSGGEPLVQANFMEEFLKRCQEAGIHTTLDTCGYSSPQVLERIVKHIDLVLYDLKHMNSSTHLALTDVSNGIILENAKMLARGANKGGYSIWYRIPLIPGVNDSEDNIKAMADFLGSLNEKVKVDILGYHRYGSNKHKMLDREYELGAQPPANDTELQRVKSRLKDYGIDSEVSK